MLEKLEKNKILTIALLWVVLVALYLPSAKAGFVIDAVGVIYNFQHQSFWDFLNTPQSSTASLYHFVWLQLCVMYKLFGYNMVLWSITYITIQSAVAYMLLTVLRNIFSDSGIKNGFAIALCGTLVYITCPHISEVLNWKACLHYIITFLSILLVTRWTQLYQHRQMVRYPVLSVLVFITAIFSLEVFYLIPFFSLTIALYYRLALGYDKKVFIKTITSFFLPLIVLFGCHFILLYARYGFFSPHMHNTFAQSLSDYLSKPPKYLLHILALGRYYPVPVKDKLYAAIQSTAFLAMFYSIAAALGIYILAGFRKFNAYSKVSVLLLVWIVMTIGILIASPFPASALLVFYDRYTYFADGFMYTLLALSLFRWAGAKVATIVLVIYALINIYFTVKVNTYWKHSAYVSNRLFKEFPDPGNKTVILLSLPENLMGVPMIGAQPDGEFKAMRDMLVGKLPNDNKIYDAASFNMTSKDDGAHVKVTNDSTIQVTLNQWGTWWWYEGHGGISYETPDYKLDMKDVGHWYELTLKKPADQYLILYSVGDRWRVVDMTTPNP